jgi:hypothetical protein
MQRVIQSNQWHDNITSTNQCYDNIGGMHIGVAGGVA